MTGLDPKATVEVLNHPSFVAIIRLAMLVCAISAPFAGWAFYQFDSKVDRTVDLVDKANQTLSLVLANQSTMTARQGWLEKDIDRHDKRIGALEARPATFPRPSP
jgi:hypothetical protein